MSQLRKTVVITGTATGLGRATVEKFASEGWNVVATVRKESDISVHSKLPNVRTLAFDVDDENTAAAFVQTAISQFGRIDVLVNNAGYYQMGPLEVTSMEQVHRQFQTNVFGLIALCRAFIPVFRQQRTGVIVNIASLSAAQGYPYTSVYAASKAAVAALSEGLNIELTEFGVSVKTVLPGQHATKIFSKMDMAAQAPADYAESMKTFFSANAAGSSPQVTADVVFEAATDGKRATVRYYSGPDAVAASRIQQLLGPQWYWEEFQSANTGKPSALWSNLMPRGGDIPIDMV